MDTLLFPDGSLTSLSCTPAISRSLIISASLSLVTTKTTNGTNVRQQRPTISFLFGILSPFGDQSKSVHTKYAIGDFSGSTSICIPCSGFQHCPAQTVYTREFYSNGSFRFGCDLWLVVWMQFPPRQHGIPLRLYPLCLFGAPLSLPLPPR